MIVVGTFTGFEDVTDSSGNSRMHNEAAVLAAQSQDEMRSLPATALALMASNPHSYEQTVSGTKFLIKQQAQFTGGAEGTSGCSVTEQKSQVSNAIRITSTVTWTELGHVKELSDSSIITPPTGSALEVDVGNAPAPTEGVSGVSVIVKYTPVGTTTPATLEATTGTAGCVVFGGLPTDSATVEIPEKVGYVTPSGALAPKSKELTLAPNTTTHDPVTFNRGGSITAAFTYEGNEHYSHFNNAGTESESEAITGDTFVVTNSHMEFSKDYEVGSTAGAYLGNNVFEAQPASKSEAFKAAVTSPISTAYPAGDLFPFLESQAGNWKVYAGDCPANDPEKLTESLSIKLKDATGLSIAGGPTTEVKVPVSHTTLNVYKGTEKEATAKGYANLETSKSLPVAITNTSCTSYSSPNNETALNLKHVQSTTEGSGFGGHLHAPFQPFGAYQLCVFDEGKNRDTYRVTGENTTVAGSTVNIFLGQKSATERTAQRPKPKQKKPKPGKSAKRRSRI